MAANDRPADIQWLINNQTDEISGYMAKGREMPPPAFLALNPTTGAVEGLVGPDGNIIIRPVISYTWATRPAAADNPGVTIRITDVGGSAGSRWISDGTYWKPESGRVILAQSATAVTVPVQVTEYTAATIVVPAYSMGTTGGIEVTTTWSMTGAAKTCRLKFGSFTFMQASPGTNATARYTQGIQNKNGLATQIIGNSIGQGTFNANSTAIVEGGIDTASDVNLTITGAKTVDTDGMILVGYCAELIHA